MSFLNPGLDRATALSKHTVAAIKTWGETISWFHLFIIQRYWDGWNPSRFASCSCLLPGHPLPEWTNPIVLSIQVAFTRVCLYVILYSSQSVLTLCKCNPCCRGILAPNRSYKYSCLVLQSPQATRIRALRRVRTFQEQLASILANPLVKLMNRLDSWSDSQPEWNPCSITIQETSHGSTDCDSGQIKLAQL